LQTFLVTGATDGIGRETARQLVAKDRRVLVHGRTEAKATQAAHALGGEPVWGDLANMAEVVALAKQVNAAAPVLDVLINNAGVYEKARHVTPDGLERAMAVNHFAVFLLTRLLLPTIKQRIVTVASMTHASGHLDLADLTFAHSYSGYAAYSASKLANVLFTLELARRIKHTSVTANCLHPGVIATKLLHANFGGGASVESGARTSVYLATASEVAQVSGAYFVDCRRATPSASARDARLAAALWETTERTLAPYLAEV
jgi:NAD(P)-dependent dehydrogenase (short-subunit alcohol dehydrogenase family)